MRQMLKSGIVVTLLLAASMFGAAPGIAQDQKIGAVTQLPLPRYVSIKGSEAFARRGPGKSHRIDWKYVRRGLPLRVTAEHGHWRRVEDSEGKGGWMHYALLSRTRTVLIQAEDTTLFSKPAGRARVVAKLQAGVVAKLRDCTKDMCEISVSNADDATFRGWVMKTALWGL